MHFHNPYFYERSYGLRFPFGNRSSAFIVLLNGNAAHTSGLATLPPRGRLGNGSHSHITGGCTPSYALPVGLELAEPPQCQVLGAGGVCRQRALTRRANLTRDILSPTPKTSSNEQCLNWTQAEDTSAICLFFIVIISRNTVEDIQMFWPWAKKEALKEKIIIMAAYFIWHQMKTVAMSTAQGIAGRHHEQMAEDWLVARKPKYL